MKCEHECNKKLGYFRFFIEQKPNTKHQMLAKVFFVVTLIWKVDSLLFSLYKLKQQKLQLIFGNQFLVASGSNEKNIYLEHFIDDLDRRMIVF